MSDGFLLSIQLDTRRPDTSTRTSIRSLLRAFRPSQKHKTKYAHLSEFCGTIFRARGFLDDPKEPSQKYHRPTVLSATLKLLSWRERLPSIHTTSVVRHPLTFHKLPIPVIHIIISSHDTTRGHTKSTTPFSKTLNSNSPSTASVSY